jgi:hypothetical protein
MAVRCSCAPDDRCKKHPKHAELSCQERNKEYSVHLVGLELNTYVTKMYGTTNIKKILGYGCMGWIELAQDRDRWWTIVTAVMCLRVS